MEVRPGIGGAREGAAAAGERPEVPPGGEVAVLGIGASGRAAARLALRQGWSVYVSSLEPDPQARGQASATADRLRGLGADVELGAHDVDRIAEAALVVVSPGIPPHAPVLERLRERGVSWISEPELAVRFYRGPLIAVTGTNGKTTTSALTAHLIAEAGVSVALGGNIGEDFGPPASELALLDPPPSWYVLEVSSYQLADIETFRPDIGVVTNLAPDHLDRYGSVEAYYSDKARIFENATPESRWILNGGDPAVLDLAGDAPGRRYLFALDERDGPHAHLREGRLEVDLGGRGEEAWALVPVEELSLLGRHNVENALAAALTAALALVEGEGTAGHLPLSSDTLARGLRAFVPLPHRLEPVVEEGGVLWVNDSKATNVASAISAVRGLAGGVAGEGDLGGGEPARDPLSARPLVVILGGRDKGEDFAPLEAALQGRARVVVAYGEAGARIAQELAGRVPVERVDEGFDAAVRTARDRASAGDVLLLAPACSSFDLFRDYRERGERFRALALAAAEEGS